MCMRTAHIQRLLCSAHFSILLVLVLNSSTEHYAVLYTADVDIASEQQSGLAVLRTC
jgi:hypothetical protein